MIENLNFHFRMTDAEFKDYNIAMQMLSELTIKYGKGFTKIVLGDISEALDFTVIEKEEKR